MSEVEWWSYTQDIAVGGQRGVQIYPRLSPDDNDKLFVSVGVCGAADVECGHFDCGDHRHVVLSINDVNRLTTSAVFAPEGARHLAKMLQTAVTVAESMPCHVFDPPPCLDTE